MSKSNNHAEWERAQRSQLAIFKLGAALFFSLLGVLLIILIWPVQNSLKRGERAEFSASCSLLSDSVADYYFQSKEIALQLPSRSMIRNELVKYTEGEISRNRLVEYTRPKLIDAVDASSLLLGVIRYSLSGEALVDTGVSIGSSENILFDVSNPVVQRFTAEIDNEPVLLISVPVIDPVVGLVGYDLAFLSLSPLKEILLAGNSEEREIHSFLAFESGEDLIPVFTSGQQSAPSISGSDFPEMPVLGQYVTLSRTVADIPYEVQVFGLVPGWYLIVDMDRHLLFSESRRYIMLFSGVVVVSGIGAFFLFLVAFRFLSDKVLRETRVLDEMVSARTKELDLLLKEVHHRVKNDVQMIRAFISLQKGNSKDPEAAEVFDRIEQFVTSVQRIYNTLHTSGTHSTVAVRGYLEDLLGSEHFESGQFSIDARIEDIVVSQQTALYFGVISNELVINAMKYSAGEGNTQVDILINLGTGKDGKIEYSVDNSGAPFPEKVVEGSYGFGLSLVESLAAHLGGTVSVVNSPRPGVKIVFASDLQRYELL